MFEYDEDEEAFICDDCDLPCEEHGSVAKCIECGKEEVID